MTLPIALTIAGSDSSGVAGIQADLKTFAACSVFGASVITSLTAQNTRSVSAIHAVPASFVTAQLDAVFSDLDIKAVKIGMVARQDIIEAIAAALDRWSAPHIVVDPVLIATSGASLLAGEAIDALRDKLLSRAQLITPNLPEAAALLGAGVADNESEIERQGHRLLAFGCGAVLIKGGHSTGSESIDYLFDAEGMVRFAAPRLASAQTRGSGCSLSAAIAAGLARGESLSAAIGQAKVYIHAAIAAADQLDIGHGEGPLHHFHAFKL